MPSPTTSNTPPNYYTLKTTDGVHIEAVVDPKTFVVKCRFNPPGPFSRKMWKRLRREFSAWIYDILHKAGMPRSARLLLCGWGDGKARVVVMNPERHVATRSVLVKYESFRSLGTPLTFADYRMGDASFYKATDVERWLDTSFRAKAMKTPSRPGIPVLPSKHEDNVIELHGKEGVKRYRLDPVGEGEL